MIKPIVADAKKPFDLNQFSQVNLSRCVSPEGFGHSLEAWSFAEWTNAMAGEAGEACNLTKKLLRHRDQVAGNYKSEDGDVENLKLRAAKEICDGIIYGDLAIQALGFRTSDVLEEVFNEKSDQLNCPIRYEREGYVPGALEGDANESDPDGGIRHEG